MGMLGLSQGPFRPTLLPPGLVELTKISDDLILSESDFQLNWAIVIKPGPPKNVGSFFFSLSKETSTQLDLMCLLN